MSGGGGGLTSVLPIAAGLAATVLTDGAAAPMLADSFGVSAGTAAALGGAGVGALAGGATSALTGGNFGQGAIGGGLAGLGAGATGSFMGATDALGTAGSEMGGSLLDQFTGAGTAAPGTTGLNSTNTGAINLANANGASITSPAATDPISNMYNQGSLGTGAGNTLTSSIASPGVNSAGTGLFGTGVTGTQAMLGLGGLGLYNTIQNQNKKYGTIPSSTVNAVPADLNYAPNLPAQPMNLTPRFADGGQVDQQSLNGGPVPQKLMDNATGQNMMFPQPGIHSSHFTNPTNTPTPGNILTTATDTSVDPYTGQQLFAAGGIAGLNAFAGGGNLGSFSDGGQYLKGPGDGMSDNIPANIEGKQPARLADSEFVIPADVVSHLGNGSSDAGAKKLYSMMAQVRKARTGRKSQGKEINADKYLPT